jgi:diguanylate cyclase (GGDEF)-like protein
VLNQETLEITPAACAGVDAESFLARSQNTGRPDTPMGQGVVGRAIREKRAVSSNDITTEPGVGGERRKEATRRGYRSSISLPLLMEGAAVGNFSLFAKEANFFNADEVKLLTELAGDISFALEHIGKEEKLNYLAYYDALTGLPNRALFDNRMTQCLRVANYEKSKVALVLIDLERFRVINDTYGRQTADGLLKLVAARLQSAIFDRDSLARIQGDLFAALFTDIKDEADIARILEEKIIGCLSQPFTIAGQELRVSAKAGVALFPGDATEPDALFSSAEAALKQAQGSSDRYLFYARKMNAQVAERLKLENKLQRALEREQFVLFYQPKVDLRTGRVVGLEALIRWNDPDTGLVLPSLFIPLLEETAMIVEVGAWVMQRAVSQYAAWLATGLQPPRIAVNVSQVQLKRKDFVATLQQAIAIAGKPDHGLDLEITESMIMEDIESSIEKLKIMRDLGVGIAIDDFGTGYSSLRYLRRLPITALKIDRAFIRHMTTNPDDVAIVSTVIALAHNLHLKVIAEGVETEEQSKFLRLLKCDEIQGYLFSKPVPAEQVPALLESTSLALPAATTY